MVPNTNMDPYLTEDTMCEHKTHNIKQSWKPAKKRLQIHSLILLCKYEQVETEDADCSALLLLAV